MEWEVIDVTPCGRVSHVLMFHASTYQELGSQTTFVMMMNLPIIQMLYLLCKLLSIFAPVTLTGTHVRLWAWNIFEQPGENRTFGYDTKQNKEAAVGFCKSKGVVEFNWVDSSGILSIPGQGLRSPTLQLRCLLDPSTQSITCFSFKVLGRTNPVCRCVPATFCVLQ